MSLRDNLDDLVTALEAVLVADSDCGDDAGLNWGQVETIGYAIQDVQTRIGELTTQDEKAWVESCKGRKENSDA